MTHEIARWLIAVGAAVGSIGFVVVGMGTSYVEADGGMTTIGVVLMVGGIVAMVLGALTYRATEEPGSTAARDASDGR